MVRSQVILNKLKQDVELNEQMCSFIFFSSPYCGHVAVC